MGVQLANGTEYVEAMLACFKVRAVPVNVNYRYVTRELEYLYADAGLVGLVFHRRFGAAVTGALGALAERRAVLEVADGSPSVGAGIDYEEALAAPTEGRDFPARSAADRYCVYTGGTTGMPKGVLWRHDDIFFAAMGGGDPFASGNHISRPEELAERVLRPGVTALAIPPFMHAAGHWLAFSTLFGGGTVVTTPDGGFDPVEVWRLVEAERANAVVVVGDAMARPLLDVLAADPGRFDLSSLMAVGSGGAVLSPSTKAQLAELLPGRIVADRFGSSETGQVGGEPPADDPFGPPRLRVDERTTVLDADLVPVVPGSGVVGHLARGGHVPLGYLGRPRRHRGDVRRGGTGSRWALPGDQATVAEDGTITVLGRGSLCINTGGEKVFPDEVEAALKGHPAVADALVVGVDDERFGQRVVALVQLRPGRGRRSRRAPGARPRAADRVQGAAPVRLRRRDRALAQRQARLSARPGRGRGRTPPWGPEPVQRMAGIDAAFLYMETPSMHLHVVGVLVLDPGGAPDGFTLEKLTRVLSERIHLIPPLRRRLLPAPAGIDHPLWVEDPDFDLAAHVRRAPVPGPLSWAGLEALHRRGRRAGRSTGRDRCGRCGSPTSTTAPVALVTKLHHSMMDGGAGADLMASIFDLGPDADRVAPPDGRRGCPTPCRPLPRQVAGSVTSLVARQRYVPGRTGPLGVRCGGHGPDLAGPATGGQRPAADGAVDRASTGRSPARRSVSLDQGGPRHRARHPAGVRDHGQRRGARRLGHGAAQLPAGPGRPAATATWWQPCRSAPTGGNDDPRRGQQGVEHDGAPATPSRRPR